MKFAFFHLMPYTGATESGNDWPVANKRFDPRLGTELYETYIDTLAYAEDVGFDWIGCNEHHMSPYGLMSNPNLIGAALIQRTKRATLAIVGSLVPLLNPLRVAEEYAMLDVMSGGRLVAGMLRGIPHEYVAYNIPGDESRGRLVEAIEFIRKAWTEPEPFGWEGEFYQFRAVSIWPRPRQQPHPPMIMSGSNEASARLAGECGAKLGIVALDSIDVAKRLIDAYTDSATRSGWTPTDEDILIGTLCSVADSQEQAINQLAAGQKYFIEVLSGGVRTAQQLVMQKTRYFDEKTRSEWSDVRKKFKVSIPDLIANGTILCGTPNQVVDQVGAMHRALGHGVMNVNMKVGNIPESAIRHGMDLFGAKVIPQLRSLGLAA